MKLNKSNSKFTQEGATSKSVLLASNIAIIYQSPSSIKSMSYAGESSKILLSETISADFSNILKDITGYVSLGTTKKDGKLSYRNCHFYTMKATALDGLERVFYAFPIDDTTIGVSECNGNKGASYSSLYLILRKKLLENGFIEDLSSNIFRITLDDAPKFVEIVNKIIEDHNKNFYVLVKIPNRVDSVVLGKEPNRKTLFFNVCYWVEPSDPLASENNDIKNDTHEDILTLLNKVIQIIEKVDSKEEIDTIISKIGAVSRYAEAKKTMIDVNVTLQ